MGLETVNESGNARLNELDTANPTGTDNKNQGDDHIRNIKKVIKDQFSGISGDSNSGAVTATAAELNILDGCTATATELNKLDGITATTAELNILDGVTATATELNILDGVTASKDELNKMDGCTTTTAELNILDGVTASKDELNKLDGCTATTAELNILDGVTASKDELNKMDGCTATTDELNYIDGVTSSIQTQLDNTQATMSAGDGVVLDGTTINAFGCPYAVVIDSKVAGSGYTLSPTWHNCQVDTIIHSMDSAVTEDNDTVYLPAGTYYFEGMAHAYNPSGSSTQNDLRVALYNDGGTLLGHEGVGYLGERDGREFTCMGKFTTTGDRFRVRIRAESNGTSYYGRQGSTGIASYIKFWKIV
jgi:hypothetical protein